jgi:hypothetical protein
LLVGLAAILLQGREEFEVEAVEGDFRCPWEWGGGDFRHKEHALSNFVASRHGVFAEPARNAHTYLQL